MSRRQTVALLAAALFALSTGCAAIPESSPVQVVGPGAVESTEQAVPPPPDNLDPLSVVRGFIEASANQANRHAAARAYLTEDARKRWDDAGPIIVLDDSEDFGTVYYTGPGASQSEDFRQVVLRGQQLGWLAPDGSFTASRQPVEPVIDVARENGQWRISAPPPEGLYLRFNDFKTNFRTIGLAFVDPHRHSLVIDRRWVLNQPSSGWPSRAIDLLLAGPSPALRDAVEHELAGAKTRTNVARGDDDVVTVDLTNLAQLNETQIKLAAAQVVISLREVVAGPVRVLVDGAPLVANKPIWSVADALPLTPDDSIKPGLPALAVDNGRVVRAEDGAKVDGPAGTGELAVQSAAQSPDGERYALVAGNSGRPQLWMGPVAEPKPIDLRADSMTRPTWRRGAHEAWTVLNGKDVAGVLLTDTGQPVIYSVDVGELLAGRAQSISELRLSRDGARVAAVVGGALHVAVVAGIGAESRVINPRALVGPGGVRVVDVDWKGPDKLVVATANEKDPVFEVSADGLIWQRYASTNLTPPVTGITAAVGRPVWAADRNGLWSATDPDAIWYAAGVARAADPFYPG